MNEVKIMIKARSFLLVVIIGLVTGCSTNAISIPAIIDDGAGCRRGHEKGTRVACNGFDKLWKCVTHQEASVIIDAHNANYTHSADYAGICRIQDC